MVHLNRPEMVNIWITTKIRIPLSRFFFSRIKQWKNANYRAFDSMYFQNHSSVITLSKIFQPRHFGQKSLQVLIMTPNGSLFAIFRIVPYKLNVKKILGGWKLIVNLRNINFLGEYWLKLVSASRLFINQENKKHESVNVKI